MCINMTRSRHNTIKRDERMKHIKPLAIKFISSLVLLSVILGLFFDMSFGNIFLITLVLGVIAYVIGDLIILPRLIILLQLLQTLD